MEKEEEEAWKSLRNGIMEEEGGNWREPAMEPRTIMITCRRNLENTRGNQTVKVMESVEEEIHKVRGMGENVIITGASGKVMMIRDGVKMEKGHKVMDTGEPEVKKTRGSVKAGKVMEIGNGVKEEESHDVRGMGKHVVVKRDSGVKNTDVRDPRGSVKAGEVTEIGDGVKGVVKVIDGARGVTKVTDGVGRVSPGSRGVMEVMGRVSESRDVWRRGEERKVFQ